MQLDRTGGRDVRSRTQASHLEAQIADENGLVVHACAGEELVEEFGDFGCPGRMAYRLAIAEPDPIISAHRRKRRNFLRDVVPRSRYALKALLHDDGRASIAPATDMHQMTVNIDQFSRRGKPDHVGCLGAHLINASADDRDDQ